LETFQRRLKKEDVLMFEDSASEVQEDQQVMELVREQLKEGPVLAFAFFRRYIEDKVKFVVEELQKEQEAWNKDPEREKERKKQAKRDEKAAKTKGPKANKKEAEDLARDGLEGGNLGMREDSYPIQFRTVAHGGSRTIGAQKKREGSSKFLFFFFSFPFSSF
jgi:hypothetical protein